MKYHQQTRRDFCQTGIMFAGAALTVGFFGVACGDDKESESPSSNPGAGSGDCADGVSGTISSNHSHSITISEADVNAAVDKVYDITGSGTHAHSVTVTAAGFATLEAGSSITVSSTVGNSHTHNVTVVCG